MVMIQQPEMVGIAIEIGITIVINATRVRAGLVVKSV